MISDAIPGRDSSRSSRPPALDGGRAGRLDCSDRLGLPLTPARQVVAASHSSSVGPVVEPQPAALEPVELAAVGAVGDQASVGRCVASAHRADGAASARVSGPPSMTARRVVK